MRKMKFTRTKKLVFFNNKGWVGKTTIAYNTAIKFAQQWYKTVIIDLDPQCNISQLALWEQFENNIFSEGENNIYGVLKWVVEWWWDINLSISFQAVRPNLWILPWSLKLSVFEDLLSGAFSDAWSWQPLWYFNTSAIDRFLRNKWLNEDIDIFIIDVSPSLGLLNRAILLGADYFITPLMPDAFSLQWIENLGTTFERRKHNWKISARALAGSIPSDRVLSWEGLFVGYIINSYNQYNKKPIQSHTKRIQKIPNSIKTYISEKHCKNWLVEKSRQEPLIALKDYGELSSDGQIHSKAIFELIPWQDFKSVTGTIENFELADTQFEELYHNIVEVLEKY
jgi:chromosome partitioning protein